MNGPPTGLRICMVAVGEAYRTMAAISFPRVARHIGPVELITTGDPWERKLTLLEGATGPVLFIDVDALVVRWDWEPFEHGMFNAVHDCYSPVYLSHLRGFFNPWGAVNSGLWLAYPSHAHIFRDALRLMGGELKDHPDRLGDQTALNTALYRLERSGASHVHYLPASFNWQITGPLPASGSGCAHVVHLMGDSFGEGKKLDLKLARLVRANEILSRESM